MQRFSRNRSKELSQSKKRFHLNAKKQPIRGVIGLIVMNLQIIVFGLNFWSGMARLG